MLLFVQTQIAMVKCRPIPRRLPGGSTRSWFAACAADFGQV